MVNNEPQKYSETPNRIVGDDARHGDQNQYGDQNQRNDQNPSYVQPIPQTEYSQSAQDAFIQAEQAAAQYTGTQPQFGAGAVPTSDTGSGDGFYGHGDAYQGGPQGPYPQQPGYGAQYPQGDQPGTYQQNPYQQSPYPQGSYPKDGPYQSGPAGRYSSGQYGQYPAGSYPPDGQYPPNGQYQPGDQYPSYPQYGPYQGYGVGAKSKIGAGLLGIFLGCFGVHNFYLGYTGKAIAQLLLTLVGWIVLFGPLVSCIWGLIEGILIIASKPGSPWHKDANGYELQD